MNFSEKKVKRITEEEKIRIASSAREIRVGQVQRIRRTRVLRTDRKRTHARARPGNIRRRVPFGAKLSKFTDDVARARVGQFVREFERFERLDNRLVRRERERRGRGRDGTVEVGFESVLIFSRGSYAHERRRGEGDASDGDRGEASWRREEEVQLGEERAAGRVEVGRATRTRDARHERCAGRGLVSRVQTETGGPGVLSTVY